MKNNCAFLQLCINAHKLTTHNHTHLQKLPPQIHHTPPHTYMIIHKTILLHTHMHKILHEAHHTILLTHGIIHTKILMRQPVTHTKTYYSYKKLSQSPQLPQLRCNNLIIVASETHHGMEQLYMDCTTHARNRTKSNYFDTKTWRTSRTWSQT